MLYLWDSLCHSPLRVLGWRHYKNSALLATSYGRSCTNQISMACKWFTTFFLQETNSVKSKTPTWPTYDELHQKVSRTASTRKPPYANAHQFPMTPRKTVFRRRCLPLRLRIQDTDRRRWGTLNSHLALQDAWSFSPSHGICFRCNWVKGHFKAHDKAHEAYMEQGKLMK